ncbi:hypothetical protein [Thiolapillus sp.]
MAKARIIPQQEGDSGIAHREPDDIATLRAYLLEVDLDADEKQE